MDHVQNLVFIDRVPGPPKIYPGPNRLCAKTRFCPWWTHLDSPPEADPPLAENLPYF
jgi:hypothetical protein